MFGVFERSEIPIFIGKSLGVLKPKFKIEIMSAPLFIELITRD